MEDATALAGICAQFPGWSSWRSSAGRLWATRCGPSPRVPAGGAMTVSGDDEAELRAELARQEVIAARAG
jgi:hypothetical protein